MPPTKLKTDQLPVTTEIDTPGVDTQVPTEKAVRDAIDAIPTGDTFYELLVDDSGNLLLDDNDDLIYEG